MKLLMLFLALLAGTDEFDDLKRQLRGEDARERREAVAELAKLGTEEAWALVFDALADDEPRVADEAQLALGQSTDAQVIEALLGKKGIGAKSDAVRGRATEALGRLEVAVDPGAFGKAVGDRSERQRLRALWSIERLARAGNLEDDPKGKLRKALEKHQKSDKSMEVRAAAFLALHAMDSALAEEAFATAVVSKIPELRVASLIASASLGESRRLSTARTLHADEDLRVRVAVVDALRELRSRDALTTLVDRLEAEKNERLAWRIVESLQELTGQKHKRDARPWRRFIDGLDDDWTPNDRPGEREYDRQSAAFVGMPVLSRNVCFLIDFSGSTWMERDGGRTRKQALDVELKRALESLPQETRFNIIPYTNDPLPWKKELVSADPKNVKKAISWFEGRKESGKGNFLSAALLALEDPSVDTIMVLTDGAPTGGEHWNLRLLMPWLVHRNRFRRVAFDSLLVDASGFLAGFWEDLAHESGGRSTSVDLE